MADLNFQTLLAQGWSTHAKDPKGVSEKLSEAAARIQTPAELNSLLILAVHVWGEHLGNWSLGLEQLAELKKAVRFQETLETHKTWLRAQVTLELALEKPCEQLLATLAPSDQLRAFVTAASSLAIQKRIEQAKTQFESALKLIEPLERTDPAQRVLAVQSNNLACTLEELETRSSDEDAFMIQAARTARKHWEIAGTWLEVERAEYRLSQSLLKAGLAKEALTHAEECLRITEHNHAPALERFFAYEAIALCHLKLGQTSDYEDAKAQNSRTFAELSTEDQAWCRSSLDAI